MRLEKRSAIRTTMSGMVSLSLSLWTIIGAHSHERITAASETNDWITICSPAGIYYLNIKTGEKREKPASDGPLFHFACHSALNREEPGDTEEAK